jgi:hypothetical protein
MVTRQDEEFLDVLQLRLAVANPEKFDLKASMNGDASAIVGWGPVHLMPARVMRPLPPRMYMLHSAAPVADAAAPGRLLKGCAEVMTAIKHKRIASQHTSAQAMAQLQRRAATAAARQVLSGVAHMGLVQTLQVERASVRR